MIQNADNEERPKCRSECKHVERPCPYVGCKYHLLSSMFKRRRRRLRPPEIQTELRLRVDPLFISDDDVIQLLPEMRETCVLDIADRGGITYERIGQILGVSKQRIQQIETSALDKLAPFLWDFSEEAFA